MSRTKVVIVSLMVVAAVAGIAWASSGDWSAARSKVDELKAKQMELRKVTPEETRKIVTAICEAEEDDRRKVGEDAAERVARTVNSQLGDLRSVRDQSYRLLDDVIGDENVKDRHGEAKELKDDVSKRWDSIEKMAERAMRGANHPLVSFMIRQGIEAHKDQQGSCDASEFVLDSGKRVDCLMATGQSCLIIELKPSGSKAVRNGRDQVRGYAKELNDELKNKEPKVIQRLIGIKSDFARCKSWEYRVDCYTLCPTVEEDGSFREPRVDWRKDCS